MVKITQNYFILQNCVVSHTFYSNFPIFLIYIFISAISVTLNAAGADLKISLTIQSWGDPELFAVDGNRFEEVADVEDWVGVQANIVAVQQAEEHPPEVVDQEIVEMILARDDCCLGELDKLELRRVDLRVSNNVQNIFFLDLMKASKGWKVEALLMDCFKEVWTTLADISKFGHIGGMLIQQFEPLSLDREHLRKVWEICEDVGLPTSEGDHVFFKGGMSKRPQEVGEGSLEENWQRLLHFAETGEEDEQEGEAA